MNITKTIKVLISIAAVALVGLLAFGGYALAQSGGDGTPPGIGGPPWAWGGDRGWGGWHDGDRGPDPDRIRQLRADLAADLAEQLDIPADDVEAAFRGLVAQRLQEAVDAGDLDQAEADDALAAYDDGDVRVLLRLLRR